MPTAIFVARLKAGVARKDFANWVMGFDYPHVAQLNCILSRQIHWVTRSVDRPAKAARTERPFDYVEIIEFADLRSYLRELRESSIARQIAAQLPEFVDLKTMVGVHGRLVEADPKRRWTTRYNPVILFAKRKQGVTKNDCLRWVREIDVPLSRQITTVKWKDTYAVDGSLSELGFGELGVDYVSFAYTANVVEMEREQGMRLGPRIVADQFEKIFDKPIAHVVGECISPGVFRGFADAKISAHAEAPGDWCNDRPLSTSNNIEEQPD